MATKIEWVKNPDGTQGETVNPVKGLCPVGCEYCYARRMYKRFKWNPEIRFDWSVANDLSKMKSGSRVFWGSTFELFGEWVETEWLRLIFEAVKRHSDLTHIFLTKQPEKLENWNPFPDNCWVGISITNRYQFHDLSHYFNFIEAKVKFISFEPLLDDVMQSLYGSGLIHLKRLDWLIIGQQTPISKKTTPKIEWVQEIVEAADKAGIPVFLKDNLKPLLAGDNFGRVRNQMFTLKNGEPELRQEFPKGEK